MIKAEPLTQEHLIHYMVTHMSLSSYDHKFLSNLTEALICLKPITSNQAALLTKVTEKYNRQFIKHELVMSDMLSLPWNNSPVPSLPSYTRAYLYLNDELLLLRSPYKTLLVKKLRALGQGSWSHDTREWMFPYNEPTLRQVVMTLNEFFTDVDYCENIKEALATVNTYDNLHMWDPTLVKVNGNLMVVALTESLCNAISDIVLCTDMPTLARLVSYGITIDDGVLEDQLASEDIIFATSRVVTVEQQDLVLLATNLAKIKCDYVVIDHTYNFLKTKIQYLVNMLIDMGIPHYDLASANDIATSQFGVSIEMGTNHGNEVLKRVSKTIRLVNSKPVVIKG